MAPGPDQVRTIISNYEAEVAGYHLEQAQAHLEDREYEAATVNALISIGLVLSSHLTAEGRVAFANGMDPDY